MNHVVKRSRIPFHGAGVLPAYQRPDGTWEVLLFRRAIHPDRGSWSVLGGRMEQGETPAEAALREAAEEAFSSRDPRTFLDRLTNALPPAFDIASCRVRRVFVPGIFSYHTFLVPLTSRVPPESFRPDAYECDGYDWFPAAALPPQSHREVVATVRYFHLR